MLRCGDIIAAWFRTLAKALFCWQNMEAVYVPYKVLRLFPHLPKGNKQFLQSQKYSKYLTELALKILT